jgi:hypothetical protein
MKRNEFFKKACLTGLCTCAGIASIGSVDLLAQENKEEKKDDWRIGFMQRRFAKLVDNMGEKISASQRDELLEQMGRNCSATNNEKWKNFNGSIEKALAEIESDFAEKATFDSKTQTITIIGKKTTECFCPFAGGKNITKDFCNCSIGWQKNTFETISGKKAEASIIASILRGDDRCSFKIVLS